ncbi:MAG TPA: adenine deaminase [Flavipsychrobacter sp.]|nr:adenine deaminase [Flavipsychrobacter sp.]
MDRFTLSAHLIDIFQKRIYPAKITVENGRIHAVEETTASPERYILPGFVDAHVHIESSMLVPTEFARLAAIHGTVATISDPHEIANVCGMQGVKYMIENAAKTPFKFFFGAPSCVPATRFETAGAILDSKDIQQLLASDDIWYLSEMMNYPGVLYDDPEVMAKIAAAKKAGKPIDGHAPAVRGESIKKYASAGISTDHESFTLEEALEKLDNGMHCLIREGSAAKNFEALIDVLKTHPAMTMFCSDDKHPDELVLHHINNPVKRALEKGFDLFDVLRAACVNPVIHYNVPVGLLREGDPADFIIIDNPENFNILKTYINGTLAAENGSCLLPSIPVPYINNFSAAPFQPKDFEMLADATDTQIHVIEALEGQLITRKWIAEALIENGYIIPDIPRDILKIIVVNRYEPHIKPAVAFIKNFGLKKGALASTVAHDCHNIIAVGVDDYSIAAAVNALVDAKGGISVAQNADEVRCMPLPVAGLMSDQDGYIVAKEYAMLDQAAKQLGSRLQAPFMTLSFMALLVIPELKLSDKGLFDGGKFEFI